MSVHPEALAPDSGRSLIEKTLDTDSLGLGPNYLEVLDSRLEREGGRNSLTRLLLVACLAPGVEPSAAVAFHEKLFDAVLAEEHAAPITGVLITQKDSLMHLMETSMDTSTSFLRSLQAEEGDEGAPGKLMSSWRILAACEDCPTPYFSKWFHYSIQLKPDLSVDLDKEDAVEAAWGVQDKLAELAQEMEATGGATNGDLKRKFSHLITTNEKVMALARSSAYMTVSAYLDMYDTPIDVKLGGEMIWPIQLLVRY